MDRALLERMVGAVALVLLLVIFAPALLDGTGEPGRDKFASKSDEDVSTKVIVLNEPQTKAPAEDVESRPDELIAPVKPQPIARPEQPDMPSPAVTVPSSADTTVATAKIDRDTAKAAVSKAEVSKAGVSKSGEPKATVQSPTSAPAPAAAAPPRVQEAPPSQATAVSAPASGFAVQLGSFGQLENARKYAGDLGSRGFAVFVQSINSGSGSVHRVYAGPRPSRDAAEKLATVMSEAGYKGIVVDLSGNAGSGGR